MEERLQKYMASCGIASRRKCEQLILEGKVKVNGQLITELGYKVDPQNDKVTYMDKPIIKESNFVYYVLNKPKGYITSVKDEKNRKTVLDIVKVKERIYPVGRLDYDSSGLVLLTNNGELYNKIIHPRVKIPKKYLVTVKGKFTNTEKELFKKGIDIGGYVTAPSKLFELDSDNDSSRVEIVIYEGKNRQIRRMCSACGHEVISLKRIAIGEITLGNIGLGQYRTLTNEEIKYIMNL